MPTVDVDTKRGYKASVSVQEIWNKFENGTIDKKLCIPLGQDTNKQDHFLDLKHYPHFIIGGVALSGVGMFRRVALATLLKFNKPEDLKFILIDHLKITFFDFKNIDKHLIFPIITDSKEAIKALEWANKESERRFNLILKNKVRNIEMYNQKNPKKKIPTILIMITELGELMKFNKEKVENLIIGLAMMAKWINISFMLTTQRLSVDTISGLIKANIGNRIAFQSGSKEASHLILDEEGAENLLGQGDMMVLTHYSASIKRMQGYCLE